MKKYIVFKNNHLILTCRNAQEKKPPFSNSDKESKSKA